MTASVPRRPKIRWSDADLATLRAFFAEGADEVQSRLETFRTIDVIYAKARQLGIPGAGRPNRRPILIDDELIAEGRRLIAEGLSVRAASKALGLDNDTLRQAIARANRDARN